MSQGLIVAKFGGTSMADAANIKRSASLAIDQDVSVIVVSATAGTTDKLVQISGALEQGNSYEASKLATEIEDQHRSIAAELRAGSDIHSNLDVVFKQLRSLTKKSAASNKQIKDTIICLGEQLSSNLMVAALRQLDANAELVDARQLIKTDDNFGYATPLVKEIKRSVSKHLKPKLASGKIIVTQGFVGETLDGKTTTLGRGGSDYSAALLAEALAAEQLQIWTDVPGITSCDPRIVDRARRLNQLTFQEAAELAIAGAKILYPRMITPPRRANIPVFVGSTFEPEAGGTTISGQAGKRPLVHAIAVKPKQSLVTITTPEMASQFGYLAKVFDAFGKFKVSIDQISTSEISLAVVLEDHRLSHDLMTELKSLGEVTVEKGFSVISLIGNNVNNTPGLAQDIFACLENHNHEIPVRMICQGASRHNFCFIVSDEHGKNLVRELHRTFIEERPGKQ